MPLKPRVGAVGLQRRLDRLSQHRVLGLRPLRDVNVGQKLGRLAEHHDAVADADRLFELMGDQNGGRAAFPRSRR